MELDLLVYLQVVMLSAAKRLLLQVRQRGLFLSRAHFSVGLVILRKHEPSLLGECDEEPMYL